MNSLDIATSERGVLEIWPEVGQIQQYLELCRNNSMYESYVRRQEADIEAYRKDENLVFPKGMDFGSLGRLSNEVASFRDSKAANPWSSCPNTGHNPFRQP